jgi:tetratricopeptide (TPR) repeat protein
MQACRLKIVHFFFVFGALLGQPAEAQTARDWFRSADSLFAAGRFLLSRSAYETGLRLDPRATPDVYLKLAYLAEQRGDALRAQFYLNQYFERRPDETVLSRLSATARAQGWEGYELNDFNVLLLLYKQYVGYLIGILLALAGYIFVVLLIKRVKRQPIQSRHLVIFVLYLLGIGILVNAPASYQQGIVNHDAVLLRTEASHGAPVAYRLDQGHRLNILGGSDIWLRVVWNNELVFVKQSDVWMID